MHHSSKSAAARRATRVLLADPQALVREALGGLLPPEFELVGCATDGVSLVREAARLAPDLVVMELQLPHIDGLRAAHRILFGRPETRIVFLTSVEDESAAAEALAAGATGYLLKTATATEFLAGLRAAMQGQVVLSRQIAGGRRDDLPSPPRGDSAASPLSPRAVEVVGLLAQGLAMKEVGARLGIATRTVAFHKYRAMHSLGIASSAALVRFAVENGIVEPSSRPLSWRRPAAADLRASVV